MRSTRGRAPAVRVLLIAVATSVALTACSTGESDDEAQSTDTGADPSPSATTPTDPSSKPSPSVTDSPAPDPDPTSQSPEDEVIAAYIGARQAFAAAYDPPDPEHPELLERYDGEALAGTKNELKDLAAAGRSEVIEFEHHAQVIALDPDVAVVRDCYRAQVNFLDTASGEEVDKPVDVYRLSDFTLEPRNGNWVVVKRRGLEDTCTPDD